MDILWVLSILFVLVKFLPFRFGEGFDPYSPDTKTQEYPDQSYSSDLLLAEKHIQNLIQRTETSEKPPLVDLLNLLQFV